MELTDCIAQKTNLESILQSMTDGLIVADRQGRVLNFNAAAGTITGADPEEAIGRNLRDILLVPAPVLERIESSVRQSGETQRFDIEIRCPSGAIHLTQVTVSPYTEIDGHALGLLFLIRDVSELCELKDRVAGREQFHRLVARSEPMIQLFGEIRTVAATMASVIIEGESGTGKELVAHSIHAASPRSSGPFVKVHCGALVESLLESELFGHVKGAFTGATSNRTGRFELAHGGTLFLDEIGEVSPVVQVKLLRFLQEREIERVGDARPVKVDVRIITASNRNLRDLVGEGRFREDLYYRLKVVTLKLAPLRERKDDIPALAEHFISKYRSQTARPITGIDDLAMRALMEYDWPGNVRELEHAIERAFAVGAGTRIAFGQLPPEVRQAARVDIPYASVSGQEERLLEALALESGNRSRAAKRLGIGRATLYRKLKSLGLLR